MPLANLPSARGADVVAASIDEQQPSRFPARPIQGRRNLPGDGGRIERGPRIPRGDHLHAGILEKTPVVAAAEIRVDDIQVGNPHSHASIPGIKGQVDGQIGLSDPIMPRDDGH